METTTKASAEKDEPNLLTTTMEASAEESEKTALTSEPLFLRRRQYIYGLRVLMTMTADLVD